MKKEVKTVILLPLLENTVKEDEAALDA